MLLGASENGAYDDRPRVAAVNRPQLLKLLKLASQNYFGREYT